MSIGDITSIIMAGCAIIGTVISYFVFKNDLKKQQNNTDVMIASILKNQSQGDTFNNCNVTYTGVVKDEKTINNEFRKNE